MNIFYKEIFCSWTLSYKALLFIELDENSIAAQAFVFFAAGYETSSNTIAFCLHELALNTEIQEKTRRDIQDAIDSRNGKLTYDAVQDMKYLDMVIAGKNPFSSIFIYYKLYIYFLYLSWNIYHEIFLLAIFLYLLYILDTFFIIQLWFLWIFCCFTNFVK